MEYVSELGYRPFELSYVGQLTDDALFSYPETSQLVLLSRETALLLGADIDAYGASCSNHLILHLVELGPNGAISYTRPREASASQSPPNLIDFSCCLLGEYLYLFGGKESPKEAFDAQSDMEDDRENINGSDVSVCRNDLYRLRVTDFGANSPLCWQRIGAQGTAAPCPRSGSSLCAIGDARLALFGGINDEGNPLNGLWIFDLTSHKWAAQNANGDLLSGRQGAALAASATAGADNTLFICGGRGKTCEIWSTSADAGGEMKWTRHGSPAILPSERENAGLFILNENTFLLAGGYKVEISSTGSPYGYSDDEDNMSYYSDYSEETETRLVPCKDPLWLFCAGPNANIWIPLEIVGCNTDFFQNTLIRSVYHTPDGISLLAQPMAGTPPPTTQALRWYTLRQRQIAHGNSEFAKIDMGRYAHIKTYDFVYNNPILYDFVLQLDTDDPAEESATLLLQQSVISKRFAYFAPLLHSWSSNLTRSAAHGGVPMYTCNMDHSPSLLLFIQMAFNVIELNEVEELNLEQVVQLLVHAQALVLPNFTSELSRLFVKVLSNPVAHPGGKLISKRIFDTVLAGVNEPPEASSVIFTTLMRLGSSMWEFSFMYLHRLLCVLDHPIPPQISDSTIISEVLDPANAACQSRLDTSHRDKPEISHAESTRTITLLFEIALKLISISEHVKAEYYLQTAAAYASNLRLARAHCKSVSQSISQSHSVLPVSVCICSIIKKVRFMSTENKDLLLKCLIALFHRCESDQECSPLAILHGCEMLLQPRHTMFIPAVAIQGLSTDKLYSALLSCSQAALFVQLLITKDEDTILEFLLHDERAQHADPASLIKLFGGWMRCVSRSHTFMSSAVPPVLYAIGAFATHMGHAHDVVHAQFASMFSKYLDSSVESGPWLQPDLIARTSPKSLQYLINICPPAYAIGRCKFALCHHHQSDVEQLATQMLMNALCGKLSEDAFAMSSFSRDLQHICGYPYWAPAEGKPPMSLISHLFTQLNNLSHPMFATIFLSVSESMRCPSECPIELWNHFAAVSLVLTQRTSQNSRPAQWASLSLDNSLLAHLVFDAKDDFPPRGNIYADKLFYWALNSFSRCREVPKLVWNFAPATPPQFRFLDCSDLDQIVSSLIRKHLDPSLLNKYYEASGPSCSLSRPFAQPEHPELTLLHKAVLTRDTKFVSVILDAGADIHSRTKELASKTPLMLVCVRGEADMADLLLTRGANPLDREGHSDRSCYEIAMANHKYRIAQLLRSHLGGGSEDEDIAVSI